MALVAKCHAADHSAAVLTRRFASVIPTLIFAFPMRVSPSSLIEVRWRDERKWSSSTGSPLKIRSHWGEGMPVGAPWASLIQNLQPGISRLKIRRDLQVSRLLAFWDEFD